MNVRDGADVAQRTRTTRLAGRRLQALGMVDLTRDADGKVHAPLLDLVPGRSKRATPTG